MQMDTDRELLRLWNLINEITGQLEQQRQLAARLQGSVGQIKDQAGRVSDAVTLRRYNADLSKESFTCEAERVAAALVMKNQTLLHENKQLNELLREYEHTLEIVMTKFRGHSYAAQTHEATLVRHYETLLSREHHDNAPMVTPLMLDPTHLTSLQTLVQAAMKSLDGRDPLHDPDPPLSGNADEASENERLSLTGVNNWAQEREFEIERLERENALLREALFISGQSEMEKEAGLAGDGALTDTDRTVFWPENLLRPTNMPHFLRSPPTSTLGGGRGGARAGLGQVRRPGASTTAGAFGRRPGEGTVERNSSPPPPIVDSI